MEVLVDFAGSRLGNGVLRVHAAVRHVTDRFVALNSAKQLRAAAVVEIRSSKVSVKKVLLETLRARNASKLAARVAQRHTIAVSPRECDELLSEYLLRHTTLSPRDAGSLADALASRQNGRPQLLGASEIRRVVAEHSQRLASAMIAQIVSDLRALTVRPATRHPDPVAGLERQEALVDALRQEVQRFGSDAITWHQLQELVQTWELPSRPYLEETLWSYRFVGHRMRRNQIRISSEIGDRLDRDWQSLLFHPVLLDLLDLTPIKEEIRIEFA